MVRSCLICPPANLINSAKVWSMNQNNPTFNLILGLPSLDTRMKYFASVQNLKKKTFWLLNEELFEF